MTDCCADKWFTYPEQDTGSDYYLPAIMSRPNFGIAVSGGGYRAVTLALGYVRYSGQAAAFLIPTHLYHAAVHSELTYCRPKHPGAPVIENAYILPTVSHN
jgi:hypothetical protein